MSRLHHIFPIPEPGRVKRGAMTRDIALEHLLYVVAEFLIEHDPRILIGYDPEHLDDTANALEACGMKFTADKVRCCIKETKK